MSVAVMPLWALLRDECPSGGIRVTGYATPAARARE
jgi:hypothetical protein